MSVFLNLCTEIVLIFVVLCILKGKQTIKYIFKKYSWVDKIYEHEIIVEIRKILQINASFKLKII